MTGDSQINTHIPYFQTKNQQEQPIATSMFPEHDLFSVEDMIEDMRAQRRKRPFRKLRGPRIRRRGVDGKRPAVFIKRNDISEISKYSPTNPVAGLY
jgi:hypothetical protein